LVPLLLTPGRSVSKGYPCSPPRSHKMSSHNRISEFDCKLFFQLFYQKKIIKSVDKLLAYGIMGCMNGSLTIKQAVSKVGSLSNPSKMPCHGYSIPAENCGIGSKLRKVKNSICSICYALKGRYIFQNVQDAMKKRLASLTDLLWIDYMVFMIGKREKSGFFRWHDSGDIQGVWHLEKIAEIARRLPTIQFWLPTREYAMVGEWLATSKKPDNLKIRLSAYMIDGEPPSKIASKLGVLTSGVSKEGFTCPASEQGNACLDCRACWDSSIPNINYKKH